MDPCPHELFHEKFGIALDAKDVKLDRMDQSVEQGAFGEHFVEHHDVEKGHGIHVGDFGQVVKTQGSGFGIKRRRGNPLAFEFDDADLIEQPGWNCSVTRRSSTDNSPS